MDAAPIRRSKMPQKRGRDAKNNRVSVLCRCVDSDRLRQTAIFEHSRES
jgi:hypothetical protein